jgi:hypothetical protein
MKKLILVTVMMVFALTMKAQVNGDDAILIKNASKGQLVELAKQVAISGYKVELTETGVYQARKTLEFGSDKSNAKVNLCVWIQITDLHIIVVTGYMSYTARSQGKVLLNEEFKTVKYQTGDTVDDIISKLTFSQMIELVNNNSIVYGNLGF